MKICLSLACVQCRYCLFVYDKQKHWKTRYAERPVWCYAQAYTIQILYDRMTIHRPAANTGPTVVEPVLAAAMNRQVNDAIASVRDIRWVCHTAIIDGPRSRRYAGLQTFVWTSHQPASQPMLPTITPNIELCWSPVNGRQEDSSQQFCHLQSRLL